MVHYGYYVEVACLEASCALLWPLYISQFIAYRFTPPRRRNVSLHRLLQLGALALLTQTIRCMDLDSLFGLLGWAVEAVLTDQVSSFIVFAAARVLLLSADTLHVLLARRVPRTLQWTLYATAGGYQLCTAVTGGVLLALVPPGPLSGYSSAQRSRLDFVRGVRVAALALACVALSLASCLTLLGLRGKVAACAKMLQEQDINAAAVGPFIASSSPSTRAIVAWQHPATAVPMTVAGSAPLVPSLVSSRLQALRSASSRMWRLFVVLNVVAWVGFASNISFLASDALHSEPMSPQDPERLTSATTRRALYAVGQQLAVLSIVLFVWTDTLVWRRHLQLGGWCRRRGSSVASRSSQIPDRTHGIARTTSVGAAAAALSVPATGEPRLPFWNTLRKGAPDEPDANAANRQLYIAQQQQPQPQQQQQQQPPPLHPSPRPPPSPTPFPAQSPSAGGSAAPSPLPPAACTLLLPAIATTAATQSATATATPQPPPGLPLGTQTQTQPQRAQTFRLHDGYGLPLSTDGNRGEIESARAVAAAAAAAAAAALSVLSPPLSAMASGTDRAGGVATATAARVDFASGCGPTGPGPVATANASMHMYPGPVYGRPSRHHHHHHHLQLTIASGLLDSHASHAPTGLSMRSGMTSFQAQRRPGDFSEDEQEEDEAEDEDEEEQEHDEGAGAGELQEALELVNDPATAGAEHLLQHSSHRHGGEAEDVAAAGPAATTATIAAAAAADDAPLLAHSSRGVVLVIGAAVSPHFLRAT